ncbi:MAG: hypothetical protein NTV62_02465 [Candidatus Gribaldobacteria bacterium]|nr:hypothetical protein [Candidatus Gribaldobacteria bacterium]
MNTTGWTIRDFNKKGDLDRTSEMLARAFLNDPFFTYVFPNEGCRQSILPDYFKVFLEYFSKYGKITVEDGLRGAVLWLVGPEKISDKEFEDFLSDHCFWDIILRGQAGYGTFLRWRELMEADEEIHQKVMDEKQHLYLGIVGVDPGIVGNKSSCQRLGLGRALVWDVFKYSGNRTLPCYLETCSFVSKEIWECIGFRVVQELVKDDHTIWGMVLQAER